MAATDVKIAVPSFAPRSRLSSRGPIASTWPWAPQRNSCAARGPSYATFASRWAPSPASLMLTASLAGALCQTKSESFCTAFRLSGLDISTLATPTTIFIGAWSSKVACFARRRNTSVAIPGTWDLTGIAFAKQIYCGYTLTTPADASAGDTEKPASEPAPA